jgi:DNA-directed RNA polymerase specialized sigma24 family protein
VPVTPRSGRSSARTRAAGGRLASAAEVEEFYRELFLPLLRRAIRRHGLSNEDARDIVQEAFLVALSKMGTQGNAVAWLKQVVDFMAVNFKRTAIRRAELMAHWMPDSDCVQGTTVRPAAEES